MSTSQPAAEPVQAADPLRASTSRTRGDRRSAPPAARTWRRPILWTLPLYLGLQAAQLGVLRAVVPRFFWIDDAQIQFTPMAWWLGHNFSGTPPLLDPDQGMSADLSADMQYGVLDVVRWPFLIFAGHQHSLVGIATAQAWLSIFVLGIASLTLLLNHRVRPSLAVAGALGVATSGFMMWWASGWSPQMWSMATLIWLWAALSSRRWWGIVGVGLASAAVVCAGNPYLLPLVPVLVVACGYERWRAEGRSVLRSRETAATLLALAAGAALSTPTLVNALDVAQWMYRPSPAFTVASAGGSVNLLDVLVGGTTLLNERSLPILSTLLFAFPLMALVEWRRAIRGRGVLPAGALWLTAAALTQLPTYVSAFRYPFRLMIVVQVAFGLLAVLAFSHARLVNRRRLLVAAALVLGQTALAFSRAAVLWRWHILNMVLVGVAILALLAFVGALPVVRGVPTRWIRPVAAVVLVGLSASPLLVQLGMQTTVESRYEALVSGPDPRASVYRSRTNGYDVGATVSDVRQNAYARDTSLSVYAFGAFADGNDRGWHTGVLGGNANLPAGLRPGYGSLAVWPVGIQQVLKADYESGLYARQPGLTGTPKGSDVPWVDLLSGNRVLLGMTGRVPADVEAYFAKHWTTVSTRNGWTEYRRPHPLPGRITLESGAAATASGPDDGVAYLGRPLERYTVSTTAAGGRLVFRTPYWNGFRATLDGRPVKVSAFAGALLQVDLPAGVSAGDLKVYFEPIGARLLPASVGIGAVLLVLAAGLSLWRRPTS